MFSAVTPRRARPRFVRPLGRGRPREPIVGHARPRARRARDARARAHPGGARAPPSTSTQFESLRWFPLPVGCAPCGAVCSWRTGRWVTSGVGATIFAPAERSARALVMAVKPQTPLVGYNNNVRHRGHVFHIQTEDSGARHPHVITHLFADGGRVLKTTKTSYADRVGQPGAEEQVRALMKEQHKAMFVALRDGAFDHLLSDLEPRATSAVPGALSSSLPPREHASASPGLSPADLAPESVLPHPPFSTHPPAPPQGGLGAPPARHAMVPPASPAPVPATRQSSRPPPPVSPSVAPAAAGEFRGTSPLGDRPPPRETLPPTPVPARLATPRPAPTGTPRPPPVRESAVPAPGERPAPVAPRPITLPPPPQLLARLTTPRPATPVPDALETGSGGAGAGRYAVARPPSIFPAAEPAASASREELLTDKTLDEVILSYLADDRADDRDDGARA
jgi:hypothetical protein